MKKQDRNATNSGVIARSVRQTIGVAVTDEKADIQVGVTKRPAHLGEWKD
jgi:hypothetical protein